MKKILFLSLVVLLNTFVLAEDFTSLDCNDARLTGYKTGTLSTGTSYQCGTCFKASDLYYRSGHTIENITNLYDGFDVPGASPRIMWTDETWVDWDVLNTKFTIGSDLSETRSDPKGFKFENISVSDPQRQPFWQTANNAPNTGRIFGIFYTADPLLTYVRSTGGISLDGVSSTATSSDLNKPMWRIAFNAASRTTNIATGEDGALEDHIQCAFVFPKWCGDGIKDDGTNGTQDKGEQCDNGASNGTAGNACSATCQTITPSASSCNVLTLSPSTTTINTPVTFTCTANNPTSATTYNITKNDVSVGTLPTGTLNFNTAATYTIKCIINGNTPTPTSCVKTITITNPPVNPLPSIFIDKDDSTPGTPDTDGNDIQRVQNNGTATFTVRFLNNGNEALKNVVITDQYASDCNRSSSQTASLYAGGSTANFDVGESFSYLCTKTNVTSSTFPNNRNMASITGIGVTSAQNVSDADITEIFTGQTSPDIFIEKNDADNLDDEQEIDEDGTASFSVKVTNNGDESLRNIIISDELSSDCEKTSDETKALIREIGNRDSNFDPGEKFAYFCEENSVTSDTFPDEINTVCVDAIGIESDETVDDCDDTTITIIVPEELPSVCENIESSEGSFGGAPFRTDITCQTTDSTNTCQIEVTRDGDVINTYDDCTKDITFSTPGDYSVACIVDDERSSDCEMGITVEAMTEVPTGTKVLIITLFSLVFAGLGTYIYARKRKLS